GSRSARRNWFFRPWALLGGIVTVTTIVLAPSVPLLLPHIEELPEYQFEMADIEVNAPNRWVPQTILDDSLREAHLPKRVSLLKNDLCRDVALALEAHPWVQKVESVQITGKPALRASLVYRHPVAFVDTSVGLYPVDEHGVVLPPQDFSLRQIDQLPHIRGVVSQPLGGTGAAWGDTTVQAAANLAALLAPDGDLSTYWQRFDLVAIIAPEIDNLAPQPEDLVFELETNGGSRIIWGQPPGTDQLEPSVDQKLARLEQYLLRFGSFDAPNGPYRIDIRLFDSISLQPLRVTR
ncbi:MAG: hypothetical protein KDA80_20590, partial [Planctomycetaceae bacterium]|nr:hypothetical protein [Planctomycetaceae bacterium]